LDRPLDEAGLIERARQGDARAYGDLVGRYQEVAYRTAWVIAGSTGDAEDAAQAAFVKAYRALGRFRAGAPFGPWLLTIVANEARNHRRAVARRTGLEWRLKAQTSESAPSPEFGALDRAEHETLLVAINQLGPADREVIACRYFLGLNEGETAAVLGCARGTVKSRLSRSLDRLRAQLGGSAAAAARAAGESQ
jgi:RNA polymerase sigma factor (sigma-70 family)